MVKSGRGAREARLQRWAEEPCLHAGFLRVGHQSKVPKVGRESQGWLGPGGSRWEPVPRARGARAGRPVWAASGSIRRGLGEVSGRLERDEKEGGYGG